MSASDTPRTDAALAATYEETGTLCATHRHLTELCRQLERELAAAQRDAERYRWLRTVFEFDYCKGTNDYWRIIGESKTLSHENQTLDAAIDAAMAKESK